MWWKEEGKKVGRGKERKRLVFWLLVCGREELRTRWDGVGWLQGGMHHVAAVCLDLT
jgi:hypothetical protein